MSEQDGSAGKVDINMAPVDELIRLPGVGPAMAERIIAKRPFDSVEDLVRVEGIGPILLDRIKPYLTVNGDKATGLEEDLPPEGESQGEQMEVEGEMGEPTVEGGVEEGENGEPVETELEAALEVEPGEEVQPVTAAAVEPGEEDLEESEEETPPGPEIETEGAGPEPEPEPELVPPVQTAPPTQESGQVTRGQVVWLALGSSFLAFVLALILSLAILAGINQGTLTYATPRQVAELSRQVDALQARTDALEADIAGLRQRVDNLESLTPRVEAVEGLGAQLESDMIAVEDSLDEFSQRAEALDELVTNLQARSERVQEFFTGLRDLLESQFGMEAAP